MISHVAFDSLLFGALHDLDACCDCIFLLKAAIVLLVRLPVHKQAAAVVFLLANPVSWVKIVWLVCREASDIIKKGKMCSLFINDLDAGAGRMGAGTQYTVNNQMVNATLMNIADNPSNVQLPGVYKQETIPRVPIVCTGQYCLLLFCLGGFNAPLDMLFNGLSSYAALPVLLYCTRSHPLW